MMSAMLKSCLAILRSLFQDETDSCYCFPFDFLMRFLGIWTSVTTGITWMLNSLSLDFISFAEIISMDWDFNHHWTSFWRSLMPHDLQEIPNLRFRVQIQMNTICHCYSGQRLRHHSAKAWRSGRLVQWSHAISHPRNSRCDLWGILWQLPCWRILKTAITLQTGWEGLLFR